MESAAYIWGLVIVGSALVTLAASRRIPSLFEAVATRGIFLSASTLCIATALSIRSRASTFLFWQRILRALPIAVAFGVLISVFGIWNDGSGALAIPPGGALVFLFSLGIFPVPYGPEAFLRAIVAAMSVTLAVNAYVSEKKLKKAAFVGIIAWFSGAIPLLMQSAMAAVGARASSFPLTHTQDTLRALGALHANSYWSFFQSERFFVSIGRQLEYGALLSSTAIAFLLICACLAFLFFRSSPWNRSEIRRAAFRELFYKKEAALFLAALVSGTALGMSSVGWPWNGLSFVALFVMAVCAVSWYAHSSFSDEIYNRLSPFGLVQIDDVHAVKTALALIAITAAFLLGWPALFFVSALFMAAFSTRGALVEKPLISAFLVGLGSAFGTRQAQLPAEAMGAALLFAAISAAMIFWAKKRRNLDD